MKLVRPEKKDCILEWVPGCDIWCLNDAERYLGHVVRTGRKWLAYDATGTNEKGDNFRLVGEFAEMAQAREALERAISQRAIWHSGKKYFA
ncbi:MAG: hypothetical protein M3N93_10925 [Acidobacteriota bacterium]|nr:hypothetical protein [Acidobacteriota bacterium]